MWRCLAGNWIFKIRGQGEVQARDINLRVIKIETALKARSLEEIFMYECGQRKEEVQGLILFQGRRK